jgi:hypothetical protein
LLLFPACDLRDYWFPRSFDNDKKTFNDMATKKQTDDNNSGDPLRKLQLLKERYEAEVQEVRGDLLAEFQTDLAKISEGYKALVEAGVPHNDIANLPTVSDFHPMKAPRLAATAGRQRRSCM